jgi:hypothetical protein
MTSVRVRPNRVLIIDGESHAAGDEVELEPAESEALISQGFVESIKSGRRRSAKENPSTSSTPIIDQSRGRRRAQSDDVDLS